MGRSLHHAALCVQDLDASLRFYRDGVGLSVLMDHTFDGDWPALFDAGSRTLRSVFLGDPASLDAGVVELVVFEDGRRHRPARRAARGRLLSAVVLRRRRGDAGPAPTTSASAGRPAASSSPARTGPVPMATVRDPDGVLVELIGVAPADA